MLEHTYGPLPSKKRRAQSQAAAVQMLRQELAQVIQGHSPRDLHGMICSKCLSLVLLAGSITKASACKFVDVKSSAMQITTIGQESPELIFR